MPNINTAALDAMLELVLEHKATDLLLTPGSPPLCRVDGSLVPLDTLPKLGSQETHDLILSIFDTDTKRSLVDSREVDFAFYWRHKARFRGNAFYQRGSLALSCRLIPLEIPTVEELGLPPIVTEFMNLPQGLVLVTGPTGSGKSTTLAAMIDWINQHRRAHIITIEDPIEYVHQHGTCAINQREVGDDTQSFARALRAALREDPDIVMLGEMRDPESIQTTLTIAETGHLVFATLHTNDAATAIDRVVDVFPSDRQDQIKVQLAAVLHGVLAQRLVPKIDGGRAAAFEILVANGAVRNLIRQGKTAQLRSAIQTGMGEGMQTLEMALSDLVARGVVSYDDAVSRAIVPADVIAVPTSHEVRTNGSAPAPPIPVSKRRSRR
jgi:twitching motility protein PilT